MSTPPFESTHTLREGRRSLVAYCLERGTLLSSVKIALVLGTLLALINDGQAFVTGRVTPGQLLALLVSYLVLFVLALASHVQGKRQRDRREMVARE